MATKKEKQFVAHSTVLSESEMKVLHEALSNVSNIGNRKIVKDLIDKIINGTKPIYKTVCLYHCTGTDFPWEQVSVRTTSVKPDAKKLQQWEAEELEDTIKACMEAGLTREQASVDHEFMFFTVEC